jgi:hypothetical protein
MTPELLESAILHTHDKTKLGKDTWNRINISRKRVFKVDCNSQGFEKTFSRLIEFRSDEEYKKNDPNKSILKILEKIGLKDREKKEDRKDPPKNTSHQYNATHPE